LRAAAAAAVAVVVCLARSSKEREHNWESKTGLPDSLSVFETMSSSDPAFIVNVHANFIHTKCKKRKVNESKAN
jgi:hypothetical protein